MFSSVKVADTDVPGQVERTGPMIERPAVGQKQGFIGMAAGQFRVVLGCGRLAELLGEPEHEQLASRRGPKRSHPPPGGHLIENACHVGCRVRVFLVANPRFQVVAERREKKLDRYAE